MDFDGQESYGELSQRDSVQGLSEDRKPVTAEEITKEDERSEKDRDTPIDSLLCTPDDISRGGEYHSGRQ